MNILITGSTGYIGRRLASELITEGNDSIRLFVRNRRKLSARFSDRADVVEGDSFDKEAILRAAKDIDTAYYLIHSMGSGKDFENLDRISAGTFRDACIQAGVRRIIYLGGLGVRETASRHLISRIETGEILSARPESIQTIWFRAGIIIGSGSASFEILRNLVEKLPLMVTPAWVSTKTEPIAVDDVIGYLKAARHIEKRDNLIIDIGSGQMCFREMILKTASVLGLKRYIVPVPFLSPRLSSYWLIFFTPVSYPVAAALIEGLCSETIRLNEHARQYFPDIMPIDFETAVRRAVETIENSQVISRWCDSSAGAVCDSMNTERLADAVFRDEIVIDFTGIPPEKVFDSIKRVGGREGWFRYNALWECRGFIDKLLGGYGTNRGRRDEFSLRVGDKVDFWTVTDIRDGHRLLLRAQMILPGKAWLEFAIAGSSLRQTAHFLPRGILGRLYWYLTIPFHRLVFPDLARGIIRRAASL